MRRLRFRRFLRLPVKRPVLRDVVVVVVVVVVVLILDDPENMVRVSCIHSRL